MQRVRRKPGTPRRFVPSIQSLEERNLPSALTAPAPMLAPPPAASALVHTQLATSAGPQSGHDVTIARVADGDGAAPPSGMAASAAARAMALPRPAAALAATAGARDSDDDDANHGLDRDDDGLRDDGGSAAVASLPRSDTGTPTAVASARVAVGVAITDTADGGANALAMMPAQAVPLAPISPAAEDAAGVALAFVPDSCGEPSVPVVVGGDEHGANERTGAAVDPGAAPLWCGLLTDVRAIDPEVIGIALQHFLSQLESGATALGDIHDASALLPWVWTTALGGVAGAMLRRWVRTPTLAPSVRVLPVLNRRSSGLRYPATEQAA